MRYTSIPTIADRSARLNPRSVSKAGAVSLPYLPPEIHSLPSRGSIPAESERHDAAGGREIHSYPCTRGLREAARAREKSWYTKINIGDPTMSPNGARVFVPARPSIIPRIRRQTCNARSCRALLPSTFSDPLAALLVHIQTEDNEKTLSEYILGRGYTSAVSSSKLICFGLSRAWHDHEATRLNRRHVQNIKIMLLLLEMKRGINDLCIPTYVCHLRKL